MKRLYIYIIFTVGYLSCAAQNSLDYANRQVGSSSHKVITLTLKNLITIVDCSSDQFSAYMKQYGYWMSKDMTSSDYTHILYENNSLDFYLDGSDGLGSNYIEMSEAYKHAQIFGKISNVYPQNALARLRTELAPYYMDKTTDGIERFVVRDKEIGGYLIQIIITERTHYQIHIQHFLKLHD